MKTENISKAFMKFLFVKFHIRNNYTAHVNKTLTCILNTKSACEKTCEKILYYHFCM